MLCYLLTIGAHHRQNYWYHLCKNGNISFTFWLNAAKNTHHIKKSLKSASPTGVELGAQKIGKFRVLLCRETVNYIQFRTQCCQKYASQKKTSNKSCSELNFVQKSNRVLMSISLWDGTRGLERLACSNYYSIGKTLPKIQITSKKAWNLSSHVAPLPW